LSLDILLSSCTTSESKSSKVVVGLEDSTGASGRFGERAWPCGKMTTSVGTGGGAESFISTGTKKVAFGKQLFRVFEDRGLSELNESLRSVLRKAYWRSNC
jgi:hypothetical protein